MTRSRTLRITLSTLLAAVALASMTPEAHARPKIPTGAGCSGPHGTLTHGQTHHEFETCGYGQVRSTSWTCVDGVLCVDSEECDGEFIHVGCFNAPAASQAAQQLTPVTPATPIIRVTPVKNLSYY